MYMLRASVCGYFREKYLRTRTHELPAQNSPKGPCLSCSGKVVGCPRVGLGRMRTAVESSVARQARAEVRLLPCEVISSKEIKPPSTDSALYAHTFLTPDPKSCSVSVKNEVFHTSAAAQLLR